MIQPSGAMGPVAGPGGAEDSLGPAGARLPARAAGYGNVPYVLGAGALSAVVSHIPVVSEVLRNDPSRKVRIAAVHVLLARREDPKVKDLLRQVAAEDDDAEVRRWAAWRGALAG